MSAPMTSDCNQDAARAHGSSLQRMVRRFRAAYADPPYPGLAHYYEGQGVAEEVDYPELLAKLDAEYDAYAVSIHMNGLREVLHKLDPKIRIGAWCKPWARFKRSIRVQYCWEPVLYYTPRNSPPKAGDTWGESAAVRDYCLVNSSMKTVMVNGKKFKGVKPPEFCFWVFDLLGLTPEDELADVYPGSGAVSEAWQTWKGERPLTPNNPSSATAAPSGNDNLSERHE